MLVEYKPSNPTKYSKDLQSAFEADVSTLTMGAPLQTLRSLRPKETAAVPIDPVLLVAG